MRLRFGTPRELPTVVILLLLCLFLSRYPAFHTAANLTVVGQNAAFVGIMACGQACVILAGGIDLSVGSILALSACCAAAVMAAGGSPIVAGAVSLLVGAGAGLFNGLLVTLRRLPPILTTLATLLIFRHGVGIATRSRNFGPFPDVFDRIGAGWTPTLLLLIVTVLAVAFQTRSRYGRWTVALGAGEQIGLLAGIPVASVQRLTFVLSGLSAAVGGLIVMAFNNNAQSNIAQGYELDVIAACVVGGVRITGGQGSVLGAALGALVVALLRDGMILGGRPAEQYGLFTGGIIVIAALLEALRGRNAARSRAAAAIHGTGATAP